MAFVVMGVVAVFAQHPASALSYQSVIRDAQNQLVTNQENINVTATVWDAAATSEQYRETHTGLATNANGLLTVMLGTSTPESGTWAAIDWSDASIGITISYDPGSGSVTITSDPTPVTAVPFALQAGNMPSNVSDLTNDAGYLLSASCGNIDFCTFLEDLENLQAQVNAINHVADSLTENIDNGLTVTTDAASAIVSTSAKCGGSVTAVGGAEVSARGVCVKRDPHPTIADMHTTDGSGAGSFTSSIKGLLPNTTYYVRAYATNSQGTVYGGEVSFTTNYDGQPCLGTPTVTDIDGNVYNTVKIGSQCWMKENLRATHNSLRDTVPMGLNSNTDPSRFYPNGDASLVPTMGYLYNWAAVTNGFTVNASSTYNIQGICPDGWHVPSGEEWTALQDYARTIDPVNANRPLASTTDWVYNSNPNAVGYNPSENNSLGFNAFPVGGDYNGSQWNYGSSFYFWTSDENEMCSFCGVTGTLVGLNDGLFKHMGFSVRCVLGDGIMFVPFDDFSANELSSSSVEYRVTIVSDGNCSVTDAGVCWSTSPHPTLSDNYTSHTPVYSNNASSFSDTITGLERGIVYYVRAYATNCMGTRYSEEIPFFIGSSPCHGVITVSDIDDNMYNTVKIGKQCWIKENMRTTRYADGTDVSDYFAGTGNYVDIYGYLYTWASVMRGASASSNNPSGVQGICPTGWHVPSLAEWEELADYVSSQSEYVCGDNTSYIAKSLAYYNPPYDYWRSDWTDDCSVGSNYNYLLNATGFSALPAGFRDEYNTVIYNILEKAFFWNATYSSESCAIYYNNPQLVLRDYNPEIVGRSVRCVKD